MKHIPATATAIALGIISMIATACTNPADLNTAGKKGSIIVSLNGNAKNAFVPGIISQVAALSVTVTDIQGNTHQVTEKAKSATVLDIYPGKCTIDVTVYTDAAATIPLATGATEATALSGDSVVAEVTLTLISAVSGTGEIKLPISFPTDLNIARITATLSNGAGTVGVTNFDGTAGTATLEGSGIKSGSHILQVTFENADSGIIGTIPEAVNIRDGIVTDSWIPPEGGTAQPQRVYTSDEFNKSTATLASLIVGGMDAEITAGTYVYSVTVGALKEITFLPTGSIGGQQIDYRWIPSGEPAETGTIATKSVSDSLATEGTNTLELTVTAPDKSTKKIYTITVTRSWTVSFAGCGYLAPVTVVNGGTVTKPADPTYTGFTFEGWYSDATCTTPWVFGAGGNAITTDATIYGKWTEAGIAFVKLTTSYASAGATATESTVPKGMSLSCSATITAPDSSEPSGWEWYVDGVQQSGANTSSFLWDTSASTATIHNILCTAVVNGITYGATIKATVTQLTVSYDGNGNTGGTAPSPQAFNYNTTVNLTPIAASFKKSGYSLAGWATSAAAGTRDYADGATTEKLVGNLVLYAVWTNVAPSPVTGLAADAGDEKITVTWVDPAETDLDHIEISYTGATTGSVSVGKGAQTCTLRNLTNDSLYTITVKAVDRGNLPSTQASATATPAM